MQEESNTDAVRAIDVDQIDLRSLRKAAGMTQASLARRLGWKQSYVSKLEADPASIRVGDLRRWLAVCGVIPMPSREQYRPAYEQIERDLEVILTYLDGEGVSVDLPEGASDRELEPRQIALKVRALKRKPEILPLGRTDIGKSTLLNFLLGTTAFPTGHRPVSRLPIWLKHKYWIETSRTQPRYLQSGCDYILLKPDFDVSKWADEDYVESFVEAQGDRAAVQEWAAHTKETRRADQKSSSKKLEDMRMVLGFEQAGVLVDADISDTPGLAQSVSDTARAMQAIDRSTSKLGPIGVGLYCSPMSSNFFDPTDHASITALIKNLDVLPSSNGSPFENLVIVGTKASFVEFPDELIEEMFDEVSESLAEHWYDVKEARKAILERYRKCGRPISSDIFVKTVQKDIAKCFVPFWIDSDVSRSERFAPLQERVRYLIEEMWPDEVRSRLAASIEEIRNSSIQGAQSLASDIEVTLSKVKDAAGELSRLRETEEERQRELAASKAWIERAIDEARENCEDDLARVAAHYESAKGIGEFLERFYSNTRADFEKAQKRMVSLVTEAIQSEAKSVLSKRADDLNKSIQERVTRVASANLPNLESSEGFVSEVPVHLKRVAIGTGVGVGAWALVLATVPPFWPIAALGAVLGGLYSLFQMLFGDWRVDFAKNFAAELRKKSLKVSLREANTEFWDEFEASASDLIEKVEADFIEYQSRLERIATGDPDETRDRLKRDIDRSQQLASFFREIPFPFGTSD